MILNTVFPIQMNYVWGDAYTNYSDLHIVHKYLSHTVIPIKTYYYCVNYKYFHIRMETHMIMSHGSHYRDMINSRHLKWNYCWHPWKTGMKLERNWALRQLLFQAVSENDYFSNGDKPLLNSVTQNNQPLDPACRWGSVCSFPILHGSTAAQAYSSHSEWWEPKKLNSISTVIPVAKLPWQQPKVKA